jgi:hypothetical protein
MVHKRVAIVQSCYIPWKGYFDLIRAVDEFILLDEVQFTKRDWRSRNRIKTKDGLAWLSVPVATKGLYHQRIVDATIADDAWSLKHWRRIAASYARAPCFDDYAGPFEAIYRTPPSDRLSTVNGAFIAATCRALGLTTRISSSASYQAGAGRNERLIDLCRAAGATEYLSGPAARGYLNVPAFEAAGISVRFADYSNYAEYPQLYPPFEHAVTALDLLFCAGPEALRYMKNVCPASACDEQREQAELSAGHHGS